MGFKVGDKVRHIVSGKEYWVSENPMIGRPPSPYKTWVSPVNWTRKTYSVSTANLELATEYKPTEKENEMAKLYEVNQGEETVFATKLAVNSKGEWVMEPKGGGTVFAVDPKSVEEVLPYSVDVNFYNETKNYSYISTEGKFEVGDCIMINNQLAFVVGVGTKSKNATKELDAKFKFVTQKVT